MWSWEKGFVSKNAWCWWCTRATAAREMICNGPNVIYAPDLQFPGPRLSNMAVNTFSLMQSWRTINEQGTKTKPNILRISWESLFITNWYISFCSIVWFGYLQVLHVGSSGHPTIPSSKFQSPNPPFFPPQIRIPSLSTFLVLSKQFSFLRVESLCLIFVSSCRRDFSFLGQSKTLKQWSYNFISDSISLTIWYFAGDWKRIRLKIRAEINAKKRVQGRFKSFHRSVVKVSILSSPHPPTANGYQIL
jgi:hypothetical protein